MRARLTLVALLVVIAAVIGRRLWDRGGRDDGPPDPTTAARAGSDRSLINPSVPIEPASGTARAEVSVVSERGPIAGAIVRWAPREGDVVAVTTDAQGRAVSELAVGSWVVSASAPGFVPVAQPRRDVRKDERIAITIKLVAGGRLLTGVVTDATGGTIAGARIDAAVVDSAVRPSDAVAATFTGADGSYKLTVPEGRLLVAASSPDYAAQSRHVEITNEGGRADFALVPGGVIEGVVKDATTKQPIDGATVTAQRDGGGGVVLASGSHRTVSRGGGRFRFSGLRPGAYELTARADLRVTPTPTTIGIGVAEQTTEVELFVSAALIVAGRVVDENNAPMPYAEVAASAPHNREGETADGDGKFAFVGISPGHYVLFAHGKDVVPDGNVELDISTAGATNVELRVRRGIRVVGHVDPRQPCTVTYERVDDRRELGAPGVAAATTGDNGEFSLGPTQPERATLTARCRSGDHGSLDVDVGPAMATAVIAVSGGASIAGRVVDRKGAPVAAAQVMAAPDGEQRRIEIANGVVTSGAQALTNERGEYLISGLDAGPYRVTALDGGRPLRAAKPARVTLGERERKTGVNLEVDRANGVIAGVVIGPDGKPLAEAWVSAHQDIRAMARELAADDDEPGSGSGSRRRSVSTSITTDNESGLANDVAPVITDAQGRFRIAGLPHGSYEVIAEARAGALRARLRDVRPDATITLAIAALTSLRGTVHGAAGPARVFELEVHGPTSTTRTFTDGKFEIGRVDPGDYSLIVRSADGNAERKVTIVAGQAAELDIELARNAVVIGRLVDGSGKPLAQQGIVLLADQGPHQLSVTLSGPPPHTAADGSFRLEGPGIASVLVVLRPQRPWSKRPLALVAGETLDLGTVVVDGQDKPQAPKS